MVKILGTGDFFCVDKMPENGYRGFSEISNFINSHEIKFTNLETTVHNNEGFPSLFPGGGYAMASPKILKDLKKFGFNLVNIANNHMMDYSHDGLLATLNNLDIEGIKYSGAGKDLFEAAKPVYIEATDCRVALISATSSFHDSDAAGYRNETSNGRPGVNPLRHTEILEITDDLMEAIQKIATETGLNEYRNMGVSTGYVKPSEYVKLRDLCFKLGKKTQKISIPLKKDMDRIVYSIKEAKRQSDCVIFSLHGHQIKGTQNQADDFFVEACRIAVDAGADIVFGHGVHVMRGIEKYKDSIIFYGLGDFLLKNELVETLPSDLIDRYDISHKDSIYPGYLMDIRSKNGTVGLSAMPEAFESIIASIDFVDKVKIVKLYPISLNYNHPRSRRGWPILASDNSEILVRLKNLSKIYNTDIIIDKGIGEIKF